MVYRGESRRQDSCSSTLPIHDESYGYRRDEFAKSAEFSEQDISEQP